MLSHFLLSDTLSRRVFVWKQVFSKFRRFFIFLQIFFSPSFKEILIAKKISKSALGKRFYSHNGLALQQFFSKYGIFMLCLREYNTFNLPLKPISERRQKRRHVSVALNTDTIPSAQAGRSSSEPRGTQCSELLCTQHSCRSPSGRASCAAGPAHLHQARADGHSSQEL